jgi:hypothetical protein
MNFWIAAFPEAMVELSKTEAFKQGHLSDWGIGRCSNWPALQAKLDLARREYEYYHDPQHVGRFRRKVRGALDKSVVPLEQIVKGVPSLDVTSPIISIANALLDVSTETSQRKARVLTKPRRIVKQVKCVRQSPHPLTIYQRLSLQQTFTVETTRMTRIYSEHLFVSYCPCSRRLNTQYCPIRANKVSHPSKIDKLQ